MKFVIGKRYKFSDNSNLHENIRNMYFVPVEVHSSHVVIEIYDNNGRLIMNGDRRTWNGNPESNSGWEHWIDPAYGNVWGKSKLEFKFVC